MRQSLKKTVFGGLALAAAVAAGSACSGQQPAPASARAGQPPVATTAAAGPPKAAAPLPGAPPDRPTTSASATRRANVEVALIDRMAGDSVSWTDGKIVPAKLNNQVPEALPGPEHKHTAVLASNVAFYLWDNAGNLQLDAHGLGTVPCTKEKFIRARYWNTKISFNASGQISKIAARYQP